jgi:hypothetical protein
VAQQNLTYDGTTLRVNGRALSLTQLGSPLAGQTFTIYGGTGDGASSLTIGQGQNFFFRTLMSSSRPGILNQGSLLDIINALTITTGTTTMNCALANDFTLTLAASATTTINITSWSAATNSGYSGEYFLRITQPAGGNGLVSLPAFVRQPSGSSYTPTATAGAVDILHFKSFDLTNLYLINVYKNMV